jgi:hypothetical protein
VRPDGGSYDELFDDAISFTSDEKLLDEENCHRYSIVPAPPEAAVELVNATGSPPEHIVSPPAMVPADAGFIHPRPIA